MINILKQSSALSAQQQVLRLAQRLAGLSVESQAGPVHRLHQKPISPSRKRRKTAGDAVEQEYANPDKASPSERRQRISACDDGGRQRAPALRNQGRRRHWQADSKNADPNGYIRSLLDMTAPASWYPAARTMQRRVVAHLGPTNSGKTHAALEALAAAPSGVYCGPLRLLACEVSDRLNARGVACSLVTGQEVKPVAGAAHAACTVEMADVGRAISVGIVDEIQMMGCVQRGWAWSRALLGLPAHELHVCGDPAAEALLRRLVEEECGDELHVLRQVKYQRLSPLVVQGSALLSLSDMQPGDCVVAFSRRAVHGLKRDILRRTALEPCVVYGGLPPDTRRQQADLFNHGAFTSPASTTSSATPPASSAALVSKEPSPWPDAAFHPHRHRHPPPPARAKPNTIQPTHHASRHFPAAVASASDSVSAAVEGAHVICTTPQVMWADKEEEEDGLEDLLAHLPRATPRVLVASDAIGMGLNLNIRRVIFSSMHKYDGKQLRPLTASEVRQIAGRAGRYGSTHAGWGAVTCLSPDDLPLLHEALSQPHEYITHACLLPPPERLAAYMGRFQERSFAASLLAYAESARLAPHYVYADITAQYRAACALRAVGQSLSPEEMMMFTTAPVDMNDPQASAALLRFVSAHVRLGEVDAGSISHVGAMQLPGSEAELRSLEQLHRVYDLYCWLAQRMPRAFTAGARAHALRTQCAELIRQGLDCLATFHYNWRPHTHHNTSKHHRGGGRNVYAHGHAGAESARRSQDGRAHGGAHADASDGEHSDDDDDDRSWHSRHGRHLHRQPRTL